MVKKPNNTNVTGRNIENLPVVPRLPNYRGSAYGKAVPRELRGAEIMRFGTVDEVDLEGGGLVIDYRTKNSATTKRIVLSFNELGMWVAFRRALKESPNQDEALR
jgi:hypothetical protein